MAPANTAISTKGTRIASGSTGTSRPMRKRFSPPPSTLTRGFVGWRRVVDMGTLSGEPDAWIDIGVEDVDEEIDQHDHDPGFHHDALHKREVTLEDSLVQQPADAGPGEDHLDDHRCVQHHYKVDSGQGQH